MPATADKNVLFGLGNNFLQHDKAVETANDLYWIPSMMGLLVSGAPDFERLLPQEGTPQMDMTVRLGGMGEIRSTEIQEAAYSNYFSTINRWTTSNYHPSHSWQDRIPGCGPLPAGTGCHMPQSRYRYYGLLQFNTRCKSIT